MSSEKAAEQKVVDCSPNAFLRWVLVAKNFFPPYSPRAINRLEKSKNCSCPLCIISSVIAKENVDINKPALRPGMNCDVRLGNDYDTGNPPSRAAGVISKFMETARNYLKAGISYNAKSFFANDAFLRQKARLSSAIIKIGQYV